MLIFTAIMVTVLAIIDCALTHAAFSLDDDVFSTYEPGTETSEIQIEENRGIEVSAV